MEAQELEQAAWLIALRKRVVEFHYDRHTQFLNTLHIDMEVESTFITKVETI